MRLPEICYEKAFWVVISVFGTVIISVTGVVWGMIQDNVETIHEIELQVAENNVPELKSTVRGIDEKVDNLLISQARIEQKLNLIIPNP